MRSPRIVIVGGGIGGLALAAALRRLELRALVLEQAEELREVGAGLAVLPSAVRALEAIGIAHRQLGGAPLARVRICNHEGRELKAIDAPAVVKSVAGYAYVLSRARLLSALRAGVDAADIRTNARVVSIEQTESEVRIHVDGDSNPIVADVLVGADGLRSVVRDHVLHDGAPRYAGETCFRGIADVSLGPGDGCREVFGAGRRAAYYDMGEGRCYWWATSTEPEGTLVAPVDRNNYLRDRFEGWPFGLPELFARTPADRILQNDLFDRDPMRGWHRGRVVLLGDAAHPTTPNLGQGACMAIEDAVVLARSIAEHPDARRAFIRYERARSRRTASLVRLSRLWGHVGLWKDPRLMALRDAFFRFFPRAGFERVLRQQYDYRPGLLLVTRRS
jgi:2-polyprenyl-6-methoxyphenol hydroxylase-like FAD-dependent oxidoreductase